MSITTQPLIETCPTIVSAEVANQFAIAVIEVPRSSYHQQTKTAMRVASKVHGGISYGGPLRLCMHRWIHIHTFYLIELSPDNYYQAQSLSHHPHYSILRSEFSDYEQALLQFQSLHLCKIKRIKADQNFQDDFLIVINDFKEYPTLNCVLANVNDSHLLSELLSNAKLDKNRGNWKMDFGFACGQNLHRDLDEYGVTQPRILTRSSEPVFIDIQKQLSIILDVVSLQFNLPSFHRMDEIHLLYSSQLHSNGLYPAWRAAAHGRNNFVDVHEDSLNNPCPFNVTGWCTFLHLQNEGGTTTSH